MTEVIKPLCPNAVTMMALVFGVSALNKAMWGDWQWAVCFILLAGFFDFMDGKVARLLGVSSKFGAELDSLSDFVSFGVAPGFLMYNWTMDSTLRLEALRDITYKPGAIGVYWWVVLFFAMCCASRLARFNTMLDERQPLYWKHFFMGVPAPAGAGLAMLPLVLWLAFGEEFFRHPIFVSAFVLFAGVMMASRVPTIGLKHIHIAKSMRSFVGFCLLGFICSLATFPWLSLSFLGVLYFCSIPVGIYVFLNLKKQAETKKGG